MVRWERETEHVGIFLKGNSLAKMPLYKFYLVVKAPAFHRRENSTEKKNKKEKLPEDIRLQRRKKDVIPKIGHPTAQHMIFLKYL